MVPTYGWYNANGINWDAMGEPICPDEGVHFPYCGERLHRTFQKRCGKCKTEIDWEFSGDFAGETQLYGSWKKVRGLWEPDPKKGDFSAVYNSNDNEIRVEWSEKVRYGRAGNLCIPGQVHAEEDDPDSPEGLEITEMQPGEVWWGQFVPGSKLLHPYYALPDECFYRRDGNE